MIEEESNLFSFKVVAYSIYCFFLLNILVSVGCAVFYFKSLSTHEQQHLLQGVEVAVAVEQHRLQDLLVEYSFWNEGYEKTVQNGDREQFNEIYGESLVEAHHLSFTAIGKGNEDVLFSSSAPGKPYVDRKTISESGIDAIVSRGFKAPGLTKDISGFVCIDGLPYLVAVAPFIDQVSGEVRPDHSYVLFGKEIEEGFLDIISKRYHLPPLDVSFVSQPPKISFGLFTHADYPEVLLQFDAPAKNWPLLFKLLSVILLFGGGTFALLWFFLNRYHQLHSVHEAKLLEMASRDGLTGAFTRREFSIRGQRLFTQVEEEFNGLGVLMIDIDHFKAINDKHGHSAGDKNLQFCVKIINSCVRGNDVLGRLGGEEFAIVLPNVTVTKTYEIAERIRSHIEKSSLAGRGGVIPMTVSIGAVHVDGGDSFEGALSSADILLYKAKQMGRNHVVTADQFSKVED
jgi:diguanylate cyclase (GGDEF)-like protein